MEIGKSKSAAVVCAVAILWCSQQFCEALERNTGIWRTLRSGGFSGPMNEGAHVRAIKGSIDAQGKQYKFWEYEWVNKENGHGGNALLVFEQAGSKLSYLGSYEVDGSDFRGPVHPVIRGKTVFYPYHDIEIMGVKQSVTISFENGPPTTTVPGGVSRFIK